MIIECTSCHARYQYDEERFERKPSKKIKCAKCSNVFDIENPAFAARPSASASDSTAARRDETRSSRRPESEEKTAQAPVPETGPAPAAPQLPRGRRLSIAIIAGNDAGTVFRVEKPRMTIGRSGADITINDSEASRQHAAVEVRDSVVTVEDLGSTNGTLVDGVKLSARAELQDKSEFQIGATTLMLIVTDDG